MRSVWLILSTVLILVCAFAAYLRLAPPPVHFVSTDSGKAAPTPATPTDSNHPLGPAVGAWVHLFDKDGDYYGQWRSQGYVPDAQDPDTFHLTNPEAEFYQHDG